MKFIAVMLAWLLCSHATAIANPVRVLGSGPSVEEAKINGFRIAVDIVSGSVIVANRHVVNDQVVNNEVLNYSSGFVEKYNIVSQTNLPNATQLVMDVWVAESKIADRILGITYPNNPINGPVHSAQIQTIKTTKQQGDQLLEVVLRDYPNKAFVVSQKGYSIVMDNSRQNYLVVPVEIKWNQNYVLALDEVVAILANQTHDVGRILANATGTNSQHVTIMGKKTENVFFGFRNQYQIKDSITYGKLNQWFLNNFPMVMMELKDDTSVILKKCFQIENGTSKHPLYYAGNNFVLHGNNVEKSFINLKIDNMLESQLSKVRNIDLKIVTQKQCI